MIESITLTPRQDGPGLDALLKGDLARLLVLCVAGSGQTKAPGAFALGGLSLSVVAGTRNHLELLLLWTGFPV